MRRAPIGFIVLQGTFYIILPNPRTRSKFSPLVPILLLVLSFIVLFTVKQLYTKIFANCLSRPGWPCFLQALECLQYRMGMSVIMAEKKGEVLVKGKKEVRLNILSHQRNANQDRHEIPSHPPQDGYIRKRQTIKSAVKDGGKLERWWLILCVKLTGCVNILMGCSDVWLGNTAGCFWKKLSFESAEWRVLLSPIWASPQAFGLGPELHQQLS